MEHQVVIQLGEGSWQLGFPTVIVQIWGRDRNAGQLEQTRGRLPAAPHIQALLQRWQREYTALNANLGLRNPAQVMEIEIERNDITHISDVKFDDLCDDLKQQFNDWIHGPSFLSVDQSLRRYLDPNSQIQVVIEAEDPGVRRFPWHLWNFFEDYPHAEVALSNLEYRKVQPTAQQVHEQVRILSILGDTTGIQVEKDRAFLETLEGTDIHFLQEPSREEFDENLWDENGWDILFFAGHSSTQPGEQTGHMQINATESVSISQLRVALKTAIRQGLQLAIFNSCEGMGLARELAGLHIPYLIVMREPVPDQVAQQFLKNFLKAFSKGKSLPLAMREARERLNGLENRFPCASWLPVICQNPTAQPLSWQSLRQSTDNITSNQRQTQPQLKSNSLISQFDLRALSKRITLKKVFLIAMIITLILMGIREIGVLEPLELSAYDHLLRLRTPEKRDGSILIVEVTSPDLSAYGSDRLDDASVTKLIDKLEEHKPSVIGLDIYRAEPDGSEEEREQLINKFQNNPNLFTICRYLASTPAKKPPTEFFKENLLSRLGFTDFQVDGDNTQYTIRRHILAYNSDAASSTNRCSSLSLSLVLAVTYLNHNQVKPLGYNHDEPHNDLRLGKMRFRNLSENSLGRFVGYQNLVSTEDEVMLNYRRPPINKRSPFRTVTMSDVLAEKVLPRYIENKIVLIGVTSSDSRDIHHTPYGPMYGVEIHAHMVSQLVKGAEEGRKLIWSLPKWHIFQWGDMLWVFVWSVLGGLFIWLWQTKLTKAIVGTFSVLISLYIVSLLLMIQGGWMPLVPATFAILSTGATLAIYKFVSFFNHTHTEGANSNAI